MAKDKRIGFVGVGRMGANMARRLKDCGYTVSAVYDVYKEGAAALAEELGCEHSLTLEGITAASDIVITVVTNDAAQKKIFSAKKDNLLKSKAGGKLFINCATVAPDTHVAVEELCKAAKAKSLEACMASSIPQARQGTLYLMIGGNKRTFTSVEPMLKDMSKDLLYIGETGRAAQVKALVNMVMNINTAALAEGLGLADALGLDLGVVRKVFSQTGANSRVLETDGEDMAIRDHDCYFSCEHAAKDSKIAGKLGKSAKVKMPLNDATIGQYETMVEQGLGHLDKSGVAELTFKGRHKLKKVSKK